jgi:hypothetical protein
MQLDWTISHYGLKINEPLFGYQPYHVSLFSVPKDDSTAQTKCLQPNGKWKCDVEWFDAMATDSISAAKEELPADCFRARDTKNGSQE